MLKNVLNYGIINWLPILLRTQYVVTMKIGTYVLNYLFIYIQQSSIYRKKMTFYDVLIYRASCSGELFQFTTRKANYRGQEADIIRMTGPSVDVTMADGGCLPIQVLFGFLFFSSK
jgi:hypothetical protein